jgi:hypothetical protein
MAKSGNQHEDSHGLQIGLVSHPQIAERSDYTPAIQNFTSHENPFVFVSAFQEQGARNGGSSDGYIVQATPKTVVTKPRPKPRQRIRGKDDTAQGQPQVGGQAQNGGSSASSKKLNEKEPETSVHTSAYIGGKKRAGNDETRSTSQKRRKTERKSSQMVTETHTHDQPEAPISVINEQNAPSAPVLAPSDISIPGSSPEQAEIFSSTAKQHPKHDITVIKPTRRQPSRIASRKSAS